MCGFPVVLIFILGQRQSPENKMADETIKLDETKGEISKALPFSNNDKDIIDRHVNVSSVKTDSLDKLKDIYEIEKTVEIISKHNYENVALQFPDAFLSDSSAVASLLEKQTNARIYVLADTSYGSCCVDEVAAEHIKADAIIHYGRACLSPTRRLPVYYVFGKQELKITSCCQHLNTLLPDMTTRIIIMYDVMYNHCIETLENKLQEDYGNLVVSKLEPALMNKVINQSMNSNKMKHEDKEHEENMNENENGKKVLTDDKQKKNEIIDGKHRIRRFGYEFCIPNDHNIDEYKVFYIGQQSLNLTNLMMSYNKCQFYSYDPVMDTARQETLNVNKALMKRYYMIQKAKDAQVVGIVVGTLGVADYLEIIKRLKEVLNMAGKKNYTFVMGKLNVPKMANFMEIDIFVLVACPENTMIDSQEFFKPIVTPYEMEIACLRTQEWTGDYVTDFRQLLPGASYSVDLKDKDNTVDEECPDMSLISGQLRPNYKAMANTTESSGTSIVERNQNTTISTQRHTSGAEFLASRSWKGLEQSLGETPVSQAKEGRIGIASRYTHETDQ